MGAAKNSPNRTIAGAKPGYCDSVTTPRRTLDPRRAGAPTTALGPLDAGVVEAVIGRPSYGRWLSTSADRAPRQCGGLRAKHRVERGDIRVRVLRGTLQVSFERLLRLVVQKRVGKLLLARIHQELVGRLVKPSLLKLLEQRHDPFRLTPGVDELVESVRVGCLHLLLGVQPADHALFGHRRLDQRAARLFDPD